METLTFMNLSIVPLNSLTPYMPEGRSNSFGFASDEFKPDFRSIQQNLTAFHKTYQDLLHYIASIT